MSTVQYARNQQDLVLFCNPDAGHDDNNEDRLNHTDDIDHLRFLTTDIIDISHLCFTMHSCLLNSTFYNNVFKIHFGNFLILFSSFQ